MPKKSHIGHASWHLLIIVLMFAMLPQIGQSAEQTFRNSMGMEFVLIPSGSFRMGSPESEEGRDGSGGEIQHTVILGQPFFMQTTEVTVEQWQSLMGKKLIGRRKGAKDAPVAKVSWKDSQKFIKKLNAKGEGVYRLPTEAEWEYACRAGSRTAYSWGNKMDCNMAMHANKTGKADTCTLYIESLKLSPKQPAPVKTYTPNRWGLYDMHGNVWEWCQDWFEAYHGADAKDPQGSKKGTHRVKRGGSWSSTAYGCRSANRALEHPSSRMTNTGFRLVKEVD
jgi:sulfatase modifying factor 1